MSILDDFAPTFNFIFVVVVAGVVVKSRTSFFTFLFAELIIFHFKMLTYAVTVNIKSNAVPCYKSLFL